MSQPVFLSSVTSDFPGFRQFIAEDLRKVDAEVRDQEHFRNRGGLLLKLLDDYIRECRVVIHLVGAKAGHVAKPDEVAYIRATYPYFLQKFPALEPHLSQLSYTQWEAWLALYHGRELFVWVSQPEVALGQPPFTREPSQQTHFELLQQRGHLWPNFSSVEQLRREILISLHDILPPKSDRKPNNLPYPTLGTLFKGRELFLQAVREKFQAGANVVGVVTPVAAQVVHGLGGVGKTRAAVEYVWRHAGEFSALLFVTADSPENLQRQLASLVGPLVLDIPEAQLVTQQEAQVAAAIRWLQEHPGWCLIIDNVDTEPAAIAVQQLLAKLTRGQVLITSRLSKWSGGVEQLELDVLAPEDARDYLLEKTAGDRESAANDAELALAIAKDLDHLILGLEQAAAYISALGLSLSGYRQRWETKRAEILHHLDGLVMTYPKSLAVTWETSFAQLTPAARTLLEHLAWFAPDPVPLFLFDEEKPAAVWSELLEADPRVALANLKRYSLAKQQQTEKGATIVVHRLVQEITRGRIAATERVTRIAGALRVLDAGLAGDPQDVRTWPHWEPLASHYVATTTFADQAGLADPTARLMNNIAQLYAAKALHQEAEPLMRRTLAIDEQSYGADHPEVAIRLNNLAQLLKATNRLAEAEPLMRRVVSIFEKSLGEIHPNVATALNNLAQLLKATNRLAEAEPLMRRALAIDEQSYGADHPDIARDLNNLAQLLQATNRLAEAEPLLRRALAIDEQSYGADHPKVAIKLNNLALLLQTTNRLAEAEPLMRLALAIDEQSYGAGHPAVARDLNNLAQLLQDTNRLKEAEPLMRRTLAIDEQSYGADHPDVAIDLNNLARLLKATNRLKEAEPLMRRALAIDEQSYGADHPDVARDLWTLAVLLRDTERLSEAVPLMHRALGILHRFSQLNHCEHPQWDNARGHYQSMLSASGMTAAQVAAALRAIEAE